MDILGWLLIPLAATVLGLLWAAWRSRERKPLDPEAGMDELARFGEAMRRPLPGLPRDARHDDDGDSGPSGGPGLAQ